MIKSYAKYRDIKGLENNAIIDFGKPVEFGVVKEIVEYIKTSYELRSYYVSDYNAISVEINNGNSAKEIVTDIENTFGLMGLTIIN